MKKLIGLLVITALLAIAALPAFAQNTPATTAATPASQDDTEAKTALYNKFTENRNANPQVAYEAGREYLQRYEAKDGAGDQYVAYIKKWVDSYDKIARRNQVLQHLKDKKYNEAFALSRQVMSDFPDDLPLLFELSRAGLTAAENGNKANNADTIAYAKKTMQFLQAGKTFEKDKPVANKDEILGGLNYLLGFLMQEGQPAEATNYFSNAAQFEGFAKKDPRTYLFLAQAYEKGEYVNLANQFNTNCKTEEQLATPACVELKAKADRIVDHIVDALARAVAYNDASQNAAANAEARNAWMQQLTSYYKYRNNGSEEGLKELIAAVRSRPIPKPGEPVTPMTPTTSPATPSSSNTPNGKATTTTTTSTTTAQPNNTTTPATTQPAAKTTSTKTSPRRAHSSGKRG